MRQKNIFHKIVEKENDFTELFVNLLMHDDFRNFISKYIKEKLQLKDFSFEFNDVETQFHTSDCGKPDIRIENEKALVLFEIKIRVNTVLTGNQPQGYLGIFNEKSNPIKALLFIIPKLYWHQTTIQKAFNIFSTQDGVIKTCVLYWEDILYAMKKEKFSEEAIFSHFINHAKKWCTYDEVLFTQNQIQMIKDKEYAKALLNLYGIVNNVEKLLSAKISGINITFKKDISDSQYCLYFYDEHNREMLYFGIWYELWKTEGVPLCIGYRDNFPEEYQLRISEIFKNEGKEQSEKPVGWANWTTYDVYNKIIEEEDAGKTLSKYIIGLLERIRENNS